MVGLQHLRVDLAVQKFMDELLDAASLNDLGAALSRLLSTFGYRDVVVFDAAKSTVVYAHGATIRSDEPTLLHLPAILAYVRDADRPVTFQEVCQTVGLTAGERNRPWFASGEGVMLSAPSRARNCWLFSVSGAVPSVGVGRAVLHVAAELAFRRFEEFSETKTSVVPLTVRERQVMRLLSSGRTDIEAAQELRISPRTVRFHVDNAKRKLGVSSRAQAIVQALRARQSSTRAGHDGLDRVRPADHEDRIE
jgi:DNA-binding CsgD family transcriptional regulator